MEASGGEGVRSVADRVFIVLECCAASTRPLSLVDLVERTRLPKTTLHRTCWKLVELGMLEQADGGFRIGTKLFALGGMNARLRQMRVAAMPYMHTLVARTGMATNLAVLASGRALIVEEVFGGQTPVMRRMVGASLPLHATAIGKALLSGMGDAELDEHIGDGMLKPYTRSTIVRPNLLRAQLEEIRRTGVAHSHEEWAVGAAGVAAPVVVEDRVACALAIVGPMPPSLLPQLSASVRGAAMWLARALGPKEAPAAPSLASSA